MVKKVEVEEIKVSEDLSKNEESEELEYTNEDYDTIDEIYSSMDKSEKEAHYASIKKAIFSEETEEVKEESIAKSEEVKTSEVETMVKSENEELKTQNSELKKSLDTVNELLEKMFDKKKAPAQKAITGYSVVAKSEVLENEEAKVDLSEMSKSEITSKLKLVDFGSLNKSERNAINEFYLNNGSVEEIKHLITK